MSKKTVSALPKGRSFLHQHATKTMTAISHTCKPARVSDQITRVRRLCQDRCRVCHVPENRKEEQSGGQAFTASFEVFDCQWDSFPSEIAIVSYDKAEQTHRSGECENLAEISWCLTFSPFRGYLGSTYIEYCTAPSEDLDSPCPAAFLGWWFGGCFMSVVVDRTANPPCDYPDREDEDKCCHIADHCLRNQLLVRPRRFLGRKKRGIFLRLFDCCRRS